MTKNSITPKQYLNKTGRFIYFNPLDNRLDKIGQPYSVSFPAPYEKLPEELKNFAYSFLGGKIVFDKYLPDNT